MPRTFALPQHWAGDSARTGCIALDAACREDHGTTSMTARSSDTDTEAAAAPRGSSSYSGAPSSLGAQGGAARAFQGMAPETLESSSDAPGHLAADALSTLAELVSASTDAAAGKGQGFTGLARQLEQLEAQLHSLGRTGDAVAVKRAMGRIVAQLDDSAAVHAGREGPTAESSEGGPERVRDPAGSGRACGAEDASAPRSSVEQTGEGGAAREQSGAAGESVRGIGGEPLETDPSPPHDNDARIRDLTIRMAAVHRDALRRCASEAGGDRIRRADASLAEPSARKWPVPTLGPGAEGLGKPTAPSTEPPYATRSGSRGLLRRLEAKLETLVRKAEAETSSGAERHQIELLARRIESAELQLTKRLDAGFAAAAVETRAVEDMLRASLARWEAQGDLGGALARLERSVDSVRERLDRLEQHVVSRPRAENASHPGDARGTAALAVTSVAEDGVPGTGPRSARALDVIADPRPAIREPASPCSAQGETGRKAAADPTRDALARIAERLRTIEAHLSNTCAGFAGAPAAARTGSPVLPWFGGRTKYGHDTAKGRAACPEAAFARDDDKTRRADPDPGAGADVLIEPGSGFTPPLDAHAVQRGLDGDEGGSDRTDFIEAARRASRAAQGPIEPRPNEDAHMPRRARDILGAKARRFVQIVEDAIRRG